MARMYMIFLPGVDWQKGDPISTTSIKNLKDLPEGTRIQACFYERDGSLSDNYEIPVVNGRPQVKGRSMHKAVTLKTIMTNQFSLGNINDVRRIVTGEDFSGEAEDEAEYWRTIDQSSESL